MIVGTISQALDNTLANNKDTERADACPPTLVF